MKDEALTVYVNGPEVEDLNFAIIRFRKRIEKAGVLDELKERQFYLKPSIKKRLKRKYGRK